MQGCRLCSGTRPDTQEARPWHRHCAGKPGVRLPGSGGTRCALLFAKAEVEVEVEVEGALL